MATELMFDQLITSSAFFLSFAFTYLALPIWIKKARTLNFVGKDMNKIGKPAVPEMGGLIVLLGFLIGFFYYLGIRTFLHNQTSSPALGLTVISVTLATTLVGLLDDVLGWKQGIPHWFKPLFTLPVAIPLMIAKVGKSGIALPVLGYMDFGILYPLLLVPIGFVGASNGVNMLGGYNGLEASVGIVIISTLGILAYLSQNVLLGIIAFTMSSSLLAFLKYNWYPAQVFPGNTLTYLIGALIACIAILGNLEKEAIVLFIPYAIDFILPRRTRLNVEAFAKVNSDGSLDLPYESVYDMTHLMIFLINKVKNKVYEREVVVSIVGLEMLLSGLVILWVMLAGS